MNAPEIAERKHEEDGGAAAGSVDLPLHLTEKILRCISPLESARLATVCKSWAAIVSERLATELVPHLFVTETIPLPRSNTARMIQYGGHVVSVQFDGGAASPATIPLPRRVWHLWSQRGAKCKEVTPGGRLRIATSSTMEFIVNPVTKASEIVKVRNSIDYYLSTRSGDQPRTLKCEVEYLLVRQLFSHEVTSNHCDHTKFFDTVGFCVSRLDIHTDERVSVKMLPGGCSLFVSPESSFVVCSPEKMGCRSNCIYFVSRYCLICHDAGESTWGVYSVADREVLFEQAIPATKGTQTVARWFQPSVV